MPDLNLAAIGNCIIGALVDRRARIVWGCFPRFDGDPVFCRLLDGPDGPDGRGFWDVQLDSVAASTQSYLGNTAILVTTLTDASGGVVRITDFAPRFKHYGRIFRPTTLVRRVERIGGSPRVRIRLRPRFQYGAVEPQRTFGSNHIRYLTAGSALRLTTDAPISYLAEEMPFVLDGTLNFILGPDEALTAPIAATTRDFLERTEEYWSEWSRYLSVPFEWQEAVIRAAVSLKLCSYEETGAIVAALTTSVPEAANTQRTWDYRFCWLRDSFFVVQALNRLGATKTMEDYLTYITNIVALEAGGRMKPLYTVVPGNSTKEIIIESLPGYRGMGPVRVGNLADAQLQNDIYGSVVLAVAQMFFDKRLPRQGDMNLFRRLEQLGERAAMVAFKPDAGLWEFRNRERVHTFSSVMCWAACDRLAKIALAVGLHDRAKHWRETADDMRAIILARGWNAQMNSFASEFDGGDIDASLLLLHEVGFVSASDPRYLGTLASVEKHLKHGDHIYRYIAPDDFGVPETAFTVCTFWYIDALAAVGRRDEARAMFDRVLAARNHVGLLSEDVDPKTNELWGNFPQTYSMVGLIVSAMRLSKSWEEAFWRGS